MNETNSESTSQPQTSQRALQASSPSIPISLAGIKPRVISIYKTTQPRIGRAINNYRKITQFAVANLAAQPQQFKVALILHCLGAKALNVYKGLSFKSAEDQQNISKILE